MHDIGTQYLESVNGAIAGKATKRSDFPRTHWARAEVAVLNRVMKGGALRIANRIRDTLRMEPLTSPAADVVEAAERRTMKVVKGQAHQTAEQKKSLSDAKYAGRDRATRENARRKPKLDAAHANNRLPTPGAHQVSKVSVRAQLDAVLDDSDSDSDEDEDEDGGATAPPKGAPRHEGGKGKRKRNTRKKGKGATVFALPEHTSAGSNTDKNAELALEVRMGGEGQGRRGGGVCAVCLGAGVTRAFLLRKKHARKGPKICTDIQSKWRLEGGRTTGVGADSASEDSGGVCAACLGAGVTRAFLLRKKHARKGPYICPDILGKWRREMGRTSTASDDSSSEDSASQGTGSSTD